MYEQQSPGLIIDCGSAFCKGGQAGDDAPKCSFPSVVGRYKYKDSMVGTNFKDFYVGEEAQGKKGVLKLTHPIEYGNIVDEKDLRKVLHHCLFNELRVDPKKHPCMLAEPPLTPNQQR